MVIVTYPEAMSPTIAAPTIATTPVTITMLRLFFIKPQPTINYRYLYCTTYITILKWLHRPGDLLLWSYAILDTVYERINRDRWLAKRR